MINNRLRGAIAAASITLIATPAAFGNEELAGTYKLISATRKVLDTGQVEDTFGKSPKGLVMYGADGRFIVLITFDGRPRPDSMDKATEKQRAELNSTMTAYGGTYSFDGSKVTHHIDLSWNEVWSGTTNIRDVRRDGDRIIYTGRPAPFGNDGKMSVVTLEWERLK